jgi:hypothetical protein
VSNLSNLEWLNVRKLRALDYRINPSLSFVSSMEQSMGLITSINCSGSSLKPQNLTHFLLFYRRSNGTWSSHSSVASKIKMVRMVVKSSHFWSHGLLDSRNKSFLYRLRYDNNWVSWLIGSNACKRTWHVVHRWNLLWKCRWWIQ